MAWATVGDSSSTEGAAGDHFVKNSDGSTYVGVVWPGKAVFPDFTQKASRDWWGTLYADFVNRGAAGFWNDMNEPAIFQVRSKTMPDDVQHRIEEPRIRLDPQPLRNARNDPRAVAPATMPTPLLPPPPEAASQNREFAVAAVGDQHRAQIGRVAGRPFPQHALGDDPGADEGADQHIGEASRTRARMRPKLRPARRVPIVEQLHREARGRIDPEQLVRAAQVIAHELSAGLRAQGVPATVAGIENRIGTRAVNQR